MIILLDHAGYEVAAIDEDHTGVEAIYYEDDRVFVYEDRDGDNFIFREVE